MEIHSTRLGRLSVHPSQIFRIPDGLVGFRDQTEFVLVSDPACDLLVWLQCTSDPQLAFGLVDPCLAVLNFKLELRPGDRTSLSLEAGEEPRVLVVLNRSEEGGLTVNLQGPMVFNDSLRLGRQVVMTSSRYAVRFPLVDAEVEPISLESVASTTPISVALSAG